MDEPLRPVSGFSFLNNNPCNLKDRIRVVRVIRGSVLRSSNWCLLVSIRGQPPKNLKKFSLNPVEGIKYKRVNVQR